MIDLGEVSCIKSLLIAGLSHDKVNKKKKQTKHFVLDHDVLVFIRQCPKRTSITLFNLLRV